MSTLPCATARTLAVFVRTCLGVLITASVVGTFSPIAFGEGTPDGTSPISDGLALPALIPLDGGQQERAVFEAQLATPQAVDARRESQTAYAGLEAPEAASTIDAAFPELVNAPAGGPPELPSHEHISHFWSPQVAQVDLGNDKKAIIESALPIATAPPSGGELSPIDLTPEPTQAGFEPQDPLVDVSIPSSVGAGVALTRADVTLTPTDAAGAPLDGEGSKIEGQTVLYPNTEQDTDTIVKASTSGFALDTILRSPESPHTLYYRVGVPDGAVLERPSQAEPVLVTLRGKAIAEIILPAASDAAGAQVPVEMSLKGDELIVTVAGSDDEHQWPIDVDPAINEIANFGTSQGPWLANTPWAPGWRAEWVGAPYGSSLRIASYEAVSHPATPGQWGYWQYHTQGKSEIYQNFTVTSGYSYSHGMSVVTYIQAGATLQASGTVPTPEPNEYQLATCIVAVSCTPVEDGRNSNTAYWQVGEGAEDQYFSFSMSQALIGIAESNPSRAEKDTSDAKLGGATNAFGPEASGKWVNGSAALGFNGGDPGTGVYAYQIHTYPTDETGWTGRISYAPNQGGQCLGVQCAPNWTFWTKVGNLPDGNDTVQALAENAAGLAGGTTATVKVDKTGPEIGLSGALNTYNGKTVGQLAYPLTVTAKDGTGSTPSSGVRWAYAQLDGQTVAEIGSPTGTGGCEPGPCTKEFTYSLVGAQVAQGLHTILVKAEDNAGNWSSRELTVTVVSGSSSPLGPGNVNLSSGAYTLNATDVSIAGLSSPLAVSRTYNSNSLTAGGTPLGGQWQLNLPAAKYQELSILGTWGAVAKGSNGTSQWFIKESDGRYHNSSGGPGLAITVEGSTAVLTDPAGNVTRFTERAAGTYTPTSYTPVGSPSPLTYVNETVNGAPRPHEVISAPSGTNCASAQRGCRVLTFKYATAKTATGEQPAKWGQYAERLNEITLTAWDPQKGEMTTVAVANYLYDAKGRLRSEWDPRLSQPLKVTYGYDLEGRVTAVTNPGQQPTLLTYGTIKADATTQRLLAVTRPKVNAVVGTEEPPSWSAPTEYSTRNPKLGEAISITKGSVKEKPGAYSYQWMRCNEVCAPIGGATSPTYTPVMADVGASLMAQVTATNADASRTYATQPGTNPVPSGSGPTEEPSQPAPSPGGSAITTLAYRVPVSGSGAPYAMDGSSVNAWGQEDDPVDATAIFPPDENPANPAGGFTRATVYYLDIRGLTVDTAEPGGRISTSEYNERMNTTRTLTAANRQRALDAGSESAARSKLLDNELTYSANGSEVVSELGPQHTVKLQSGSEVEARQHVEYAYNEEMSSAGVPYDLTTRVTSGARVGSNPDVDVRTTTYSYSGQGNLGLTLRKPTSETVDSGGLNLTTTKLYEANTGLTTDVSRPANPNGGDARSTETVFYTAGSNSRSEPCGNKPEWVGLACQQRVAAQPGSSLPAIPTSTTGAYNIWNEPLVVTEVSGSQSRTVKKQYDGAGRIVTEALEGSSQAGTPVPATTFGYDPKLGVLDERSTGSGASLKKVVSTFNALGQLTAYEDADGNATSYEYDEGERVTAISDGKGTLKRTYDPITGDLVTVKDTLAGKFSATYDADGNVTSEELPGALTARYVYNAADEATEVSYIKASHCGTSCTWYTDKVVPTIHAQWSVQTSTTQTGAVNKQAFTYDGASRLTQAQETPPGGTGCITRRYGYDSDSNRTSLTTRQPGAGGQCATEGGTVEGHVYDAADRLSDEGVAYDAFGNITTLPGTEVGGPTVKASYYVDNRVASETQGERTVQYSLDPTERPDKTVVTEGSGATTTTSHFGGAADAPEWTIDTLGNTVRYTTAMTGLAAIQQNAETPQIQITNLHGDVVATVPGVTTATAPTFTAERTEFGAPRSTPSSARYQWLGGARRSTDLPASGIVLLGVRTYVPELGRFSQKDPLASGEDNAYGYAGQDPVDNTDMGGMIYDTPYTPVLDPTGDIIAGEFATQAIAIYQEAQAAARAKAEAENAAVAASAEALYAAMYAGHTEGPSPAYDGCSGTTACASSILGIKVDWGEVTQWWHKVKNGYQLVKETLSSGFNEFMSQNSTVCKVVGYATAVGSFYIPEGRLARALGLGIGIGTTYAC
jgi:RHS repeat-associated protein